MTKKIHMKRRGKNINKNDREESKIAYFVNPLLFGECNTPVNERSESMCLLPWSKCNNNYWLSRSKCLVFVVKNMLEIRKNKGPLISFCVCHI